MNQTIEDRMQSVEDQLKEIRKELEESLAQYKQSQYPFTKDSLFGFKVVLDESAPKGFIKLVTIE